MFGGLLSVMEELRVEKVIISKQGENSENYERFKSIVRSRKIKVIVAQKGDKLKVEEELYYDFLWPDSEKLIGENTLNNNSLVCKLNYKKLSMLFTGDIEKIAEEQILKDYKNDNYILKSTILKVGHHGSKTSSIQGMLEKIKPQIALIGVGKDNKFGHPNKEVVSLLNKYKIKIHRTDIEGTIVYKQLFCI